jgi:hypothetical protein
MFRQDCEMAQKEKKKKTHVKLSVNNCIMWPVVDGKETLSATNWKRMTKAKMQ